MVCPPRRACRSPSPMERFPFQGHASATITQFEQTGCRRAYRRPRSLGGGWTAFRQREPAWGGFCPQARFHHHCHHHNNHHLHGRTWILVPAWRRGAVAAPGTRRSLCDVHANLDARSGCWSDRGEGSWQTAATQPDGRARQVGAWSYPGVLLAWAGCWAGCWAGSGREMQNREKENVIPSPQAPAASLPLPHPARRSLVSGAVSPLPGSSDLMLLPP